MLAKSTLMYIPAVFAPRLSNFVIILILTHKMNPAEFGFYVLVTLVGEILDMSSSNWIRFAFLRSDIAKPGAWRDGFARSAKLLGLSCGLAFLASLFVAKLFAPERMWNFFCGVCAYVVANGILRVGLTVLQLEERRGLYSIVETARASVTFLFVVLILYISGSPGFLMIVCANALVTATFGAIALVTGLRALPPATCSSLGYVARLRYGLPIVALTLASYVVGNTDRFALKLLVGASSVGVYAAAYTLARTPIDVVGNSVNQGGFPELMKRYEVGGAVGAAEFLNDTISLMSLLLMGVFGAMLALSGSASRALLPSTYASTAPLVMPLATAAGVALGLKSYVFDNVFHAAKRNWLQFFTFLPAAIVTIGAACVLIPIYGLLGAAVGSIAGAVAGLFASIIVSRRFISASPHWSDISKGLFASLVSAGAVTVFLGALPASIPAYASFALASVLYCALWPVLVLLLKHSSVSPLLKGFISESS